MTLASKTKRYMLAMLACLCCLCTVLLLFPVSLFPASADTAAQYMLKVDGSKGPDWATLVDTEIAGGDNATIPAGTYIFSFDYYTKEESKLEGSVFFGDSRKMVSNGLTAGRHHFSAEVELNPTVLGNFPMCHLGVDKGTSAGVAYMWNFKLELKDGDGTNYLKNPNFETGTLQGWRYGFQDCANDATATADGLFSVVPFDENLLSEKYMLKVDGTQKSANYITLIDFIQPAPAGTYEFSFEYYIAPGGGGIEGWILKDWNDKGRGVGGGLGEGRGSFCEELAFSGSEVLCAGIDLGTCNGLGYFWNFKLTLKDGDGTNLLKNPDFENGSLKYWAYGLAKHEEDTTVKGACSTVLYDESLFNDDDGKDYMLKLDSSLEPEFTSSFPNRTFIDFIQGAAAGTYQFSFDYYLTEGAAGVKGALFTDWNNPQQAVTLSAGVGSYTGEVTYGEGATVAVGLDLTQFSGVAYMWNFKLTLKNGDGTNLLKNPGFKNKTLGGWAYDMGARLTTEEQKGYCAAVLYDEKLIGLDDGKIYMMRIDGSKKINSGHSITDTEIAGGDNATVPNGTYVFSFDYYIAPENGKMLARIYAQNAAALQTVVCERGRGTATLEQEFNAENTMFHVGIELFECTGVAYAYNFKLTLKGDATGTNYLKNPALKLGKLNGWNPCFNGDPTEAMTAPFSVIEYDRNLFYSGEPSDGKNYMLKIDATEMDTIWQALAQEVTAPEDGTYEYTFDYFRSMDSTGLILARGFFGAEYPFQGGLEKGKHTYRAEATFRAGDTFKVGFDRQDGYGTVYVWNIKLAKKDGNGKNLLLNPELTNGKLNYWGADGQTSSGCYSTLEYDPALFSTDDPDDGKTYMIKTPGAGNVLKAEDYQEGIGNWIYFGQAFRVKMGDIYTFSYNYYTERTTTALARISPLTAMDQPVVQTLMAHYIEGKMVVTFRVGEQQGHGTYMGEMTEEQKRQALYDEETDTVFLWFGVTPGYYGDSYLWNLSLKKQGSDVNLFDNANFQRGGGTMAGWLFNGTDFGAVKKKLNFEVSELDRNIWKDKIIEVPEQEDPRDPNVNFTLERDGSQYDADHTVNPNIQNGGNTDFDTPDAIPGGGDVHTGERTHTAAYAAVSAVCLVLAAATVLYPRLKRKKQL